MVYTDGIYELHFDPPTPDTPATEFSFKIINSKDNLEFKGTMGYGSGYSTPQIGIKVPCEHKKSCGWNGTAYEIDGKNTHYAFESTRKEKNPILFPDLNKKFYYMRNGIENLHGKSIPQDVWYFKECTQ